MMVVVGFSHHTAPIAIREQFALDAPREDALLSELIRSGKGSEAFAVSTCNRVEVYVACPSADPADLEASVDACRRLFLAEAPALGPHLYEKVGKEALRHLLRVSSSLDSLVVGEAQILGQMKQGFERGVARKSVGRELSRLFPQALRSAKRVRSETEIGTGQVSVPTVAVQLAERIFGDLKGHQVAVIGSGEMGQTLGRLFHELGASLTIVGRSEERAGPLVRELGAAFCQLEQLVPLLGKTDIVVSSTAAHDFVVTRDQVQSLKKTRRGRNLFLIDLAVPRDVEPGTGELDGVFLYNIDDLSVIVAESRAVRQREAERAESIVEEVLLELEVKSTYAQVTPVIVALRQRVTDAFETELDRSLKGKLKHLSGEDQAALRKLVEAGTNRLLHGPSTRLKDEVSRGAESAAGEWARVLKDLFALQAPEASPGSSEEPPAEASKSASDNEELI